MRPAAISILMAVDLLRVLESHPVGELSGRWAGAEAGLLGARRGSGAGRRPGRPGTARNGRLKQLKTRVSSFLVGPWANNSFKLSSQRAFERAPICLGCRIKCLGGDFLNKAGPPDPKSSLCHGTEARGVGK